MSLLLEDLEILNTNNNPFFRFKKLETLDYELVSLIEKVTLSEDKSVIVFLKYQDEYSNLAKRWLDGK